MRPTMTKTVIFVGIFLAACALYAGTTGKLTGIVTDALTGEPLIGVNVMIDKTELGASTDLDGLYVIIGLPPGNYDLTVSYLGYRDVNIQGVQINIDKTRYLDISMNSTAIEMEGEVVIAERPIVKRDLTSSESIVSRDVIEALPVENLNDVVNLQAGVVDGHFRGGRIGEVMYMVNGVPVNDAYSGEAAIEVDNNAIQELNVISGTFNAEYGQAMSGVVNVVTRDGGSEYELRLNTYGGGYASSQDKIFWNPAFSPVFNLQGTLSGPISKDINFFISARYNTDAGFIYGKNVFSPTDVSEDFLLVEDPAARKFMSHGKIYQFSEQLAADLINSSADVSMNDNDRISGNAKLTYHVTNTDRLSYEFMIQNQKWHEYDHRFRLNPNGSYNYFKNSMIHSLNWNHVFGSSTFMDVHLSYLDTKFDQYAYEDLFDQRYVVKERLQDTGANAFLSGGQQMWQFFRYTKTYLAKADLTSQVNRYNQVKFGLESKFYDIWMHEYEVIPTIITRMAPLSSFQNNEYNHSPWQFSTYIQDKIEYEDLVINAGFRFDYFNPSGKVPTDFDNPGTSPQVEADPSYQYSPRLGLAYPISEKGTIHVSYGHFFQTPNFFYLYTNPQFNIDPLQNSIAPPPQSLRNTMGNANLKPQQTTIYELGLQQQLGDLYGISITIFSKDIRNLISTEVFRSQEGIRYARYTNRDYAFARGGTIDFEKRYSSNFGLNIDYTFQVAMGNASDPNNAFLDAQANKETEKQVVPLDWDRRHQINVALRLGNPDDFIISVIGRYGTGFPYTQSSRITQPLTENGGRKPDESNLDVFVNKKIILFNIQTSFFLKIYNIFDHLNEQNVFGDTGRASYSTEPLYAGGERPRGLNTLESYYIRPEYYSSPRRILLGFEIGF